MISAIGRIIGVTVPSYFVQATVHVALAFTELFGATLEGATVVAEESEYLSEPTWNGASGITWAEDARVWFDDVLYICKSGYTTGESPDDPSVDTTHWRLADIGVTPPTTAQTANDGTASFACGADAEVGLTATKTGWYITPTNGVLATPGSGASFTATPGGVPPTGQTTSHETGDDGDLEFGVGGIMPVTGQTTSHEIGDDGDLEFGMKG